MNKSLGLLPCLSIRKPFSARYLIGFGPDYQQRGIGTAHISAGIEIIKQRGFALGMIETGGNPCHAAARTTYERMGFDLYPVASCLKRA